MKEKEFEVIVPAYDALESELENILGGGEDCFCLGVHICGTETHGNDCAKEGERPIGKPCCAGLIAVPLANGGSVCMKPED